jgi:hypothetical protein
MTATPSGTPETRRMKALAFRFGPTATGMLVLAGMVLVFRFGDQSLYFGILEGWGILPYERPFLDTESVLRAIDCWGRGYDVWNPTPCMNGGWYSYSPVLLRASAFGIGPDDRPAFGSFFVLVFLLSLAALPPSRSWGELGARCLAVLSAATVFAVERANLDIAIFLLALAGVCLVTRRDAWRHLGYGVFIVAAILKFYPAVLLLLSLRERPRVVALIGLVAVATAAILLFPSDGGAGDALKLAPVGSPYSDMFSATNLPLGLIVLPAAPAGVPWDEVLRQPLPFAARAMLAALILIAAMVAWRNARRDLVHWNVFTPVEASLLVAGAALIVGCFLATQNIAYRGIFLLFTLPGLFALARAGGERRRSYAMLVAGVLFFMWEEFFHHAATGLEPAMASMISPEALKLGFWLLREAVWWWVVARLAALLGVFVVTSEAFTAIRRLVLGKH